MDLAIDLICFQEGLADRERAVARVQASEGVLFPVVVLGEA